MNNSIQMMAAIIVRLEKYQQAGGMDAGQISQLIGSLKQLMTAANTDRMTAVWDEVADYAVAQCRLQQDINAYAFSHMPAVADRLNLSVRSLYRRLNDGFSAAERAVIIKLMQQETHDR